MDDADVSRLVTGKARRYLRTSAALLTGSLLLLSSAFTFAEAQYLQQRRDFNGNANVHIIEVTPTASAGAPASRLKFTDAARIEHAADRASASAVTVTEQYALGFGIPVASGDDRFFYGLQGDSKRLLGMHAMQRDVAYSVDEPSTRQLTLDVPVVNVSGGGMSSSRVVHETLGAAGGVSPNSPLMVLGRPDSEALYVDGATFHRLVSTAFDTDWVTFQKRYDQDNPYGLEVIQSVYIYVDDLADVVPVAKSLGREGYATNYTLKAFDNLAGSLKATTATSIAAVLILFLGCSLYVVASLNSYLRLAHRDIGILRHVGFSPDRVRRMFARRITHTNVAVGAAVVAYTVGAALIFLRSDLLPMLLAVNVAALGLLLGLLTAVATRFTIARHVRTPVLGLLKLDREFE